MTTDELIRENGRLRSLLRTERLQCEAFTRGMGWAAKILDVALIEIEGSDAAKAKVADVAGTLRSAASGYRPESIPDGDKTGLKRRHAE